MITTEQKDKTSLDQMYEDGGDSSNTKDFIREFSQSQKYDPKLSEKEFSKVISSIGLKKANTHIWQLFLLGVLSGIYVSFGGQLFLNAMANGMGPMVGGLFFSIGLVLVHIAGAEMFTGNIIMLVGTITGLFRVKRLFRNWVTVYSANLTGGILMAMLIWKAGLLGEAGHLNAVGKVASTLATSKLSLSFGQCVLRGILCNMLVILALIMATMARDIISKVICVVLPITTFVACGFEHSIANMFFLPLGLLAEGVPLLKQWAIFSNLIPVTIGNLIGGVAIILIHPNRIKQIKLLRKSVR